MKKPVVLMILDGYGLNENEKGNAIMDNVANTCSEYLTWGASLSREQRAAVQSTLGHQTAVLGYVLQTLERNHQNELFDLYYPVYAQYAR